MQLSFEMREGKTAVCFYENGAELTRSRLNDYNNKDLLVVLDDFYTSSMKN